jgi:hypothetical protein
MGEFKWLGAAMGRCYCSANIIARGSFALAPPPAPPPAETQTFIFISEAKISAGTRETCVHVWRMLEGIFEARYARRGWRL